MSVGAAQLRARARLGGIEPARAIGIAGITLGIVAFWVALPPLTVRTVAPSLLLGILAIAAGLWAFTHGQARVGGGAIMSGVIGIAGSAAAIQANTSNLDGVIVWSALLAGTLRFATPLTFAAIGGLYSERSGVVNIGLEGMMLMGAFFGAWGADVTHNWVGGVLIGMAAGGALGLVHAIFCVHLRADQIVIGTAMNFLALGITGYMYNDIYGDQGTPNDLPSVPNVGLGFLGHIPPSGLGNFLVDGLGGLNLLVWVGIAVVPITYVVMFKTPIGLRIRSVGEHPRAADTVGISVYGIRYSSVVVSGILAALGGVFLSLGFVHSFTENMTAGRGFIALAALIFGAWRPFGTFAAALLFGFSSALAQRLPDLSSSSSAAWPVLFQTLPYLLTLIAVAGLISRPVPPAADGRPYEKQ